MNTIRTYVSLLALTAAVLILAACGGSSDSGAGTSASGGSTAAATVGVSDVDGVGKVLVDAQGAALYAADQEANGMVACTDGCTTIWEPLTVSGANPTAGDGVAGKLGTMTRPDGGTQVTFDGRLLYRFVEDPAPATVTGNGFADTFDGQAFTWHVVTPAGVSTSSANSAPSSGLYDP
jgi:predicted lipoprotein with Yx(FWY)xxD motif